MTMYCQGCNAYTYEDDPKNAAVTFCPKCGGGWFANVPEISKLGVMGPSTFIRKDIVTSQFQLATAIK